MSGDILNADENFEDKNYYGFTEWFFKKSHIIVDDITKIQQMRMQRTPKSNIYEQLFNNSISEHIDETKGLTSGIAVLKLEKRVTIVVLKILSKNLM